MLYLLFFFLQDNKTLALKIPYVIPLDITNKQYLFDKFTTVIRAAVQDNIAVAAAQGALSGLALDFLRGQGALVWDVLMAFLSLLPAIGAAIVWIPVAVYFLAARPLWKAIVLIAVGILVIGIVDNVLRPILVGKDTKTPDYVVLISTLGGMGLFRLSGFVIGPVVAALFIATWTLFTVAPEIRPPLN